jgi:putative NIF3 family GTP cyclohydrolase 1 type 2
MTLTIQQIIDRILEEIPDEQITNTVDVFKSGDPTQKIKGIVTTFLASQAVIEKTIQTGSNLIITHEPVFYNHLDQVDWLAENPVFQAKRNLLADHQIVVWRFHDYWHSHQPDGIYVGLIKKLGWEEHVKPDSSLTIFNLPPTTVGELAKELKMKLGARKIRVVGDLEMPCKKIAFLVGAGGAEFPINFSSKIEPVDAIVCGESGGEWETCEYVRDAITQGRHEALLLVGHAASEEPGMAYLAEWLREIFPELPITHIPLGEPFQYV